MRLLGFLRAPLGDLGERLGVLGRPSEIPGSSFGGFGCPLGCLGAARGGRGGSWERLGALEGSLGGSDFAQRDRETKKKEKTCDFVLAEKVGKQFPPWTGGSLGETGRSWDAIEGLGALRRASVGQKALLDLCVKEETRISIKQNRKNKTSNSILTIKKIM